MKRVFSVYKVEQDSANDQVKIHGRSLKPLKMDQQLFLENGHAQLAEIVEIISYGKSIIDIEPVMGCTLIFKLESNVKLPEILDWLYG